MKKGDGQRFACRLQSSSGSSFRICSSLFLSRLFTFDRSSGLQYLFNAAQDGTMNRCSIFIKCSALSANQLTSIQNSPACTNTIISTDNSNAVASTAITPASFTNSCLYNLHSGDTSGGTDNIFADPQFVDAANGDLRLRPTSPCIGAGTAS